MMLELMEVIPLPEVCQECEKKQMIYAAATEEERLRMEQEEECFFDCGCCEHGGERFYLVKVD